MIRTSLTLPVACIMLLRRTLCSCVDETPCEYEVIELSADDVTPWDTTVAEDIAALELPQHGTWRWGDDRYFVEVEANGVEMPATATFVHDPEGIRYSEHIAGGGSVLCDAPTVSVDGTLTFTSEQDEVIVSVPLTVEHNGDGMYGASPQYSPISLFSTRVHELLEYDISAVRGAIIWLSRGLRAEFYYQAQSMTSETTGQGVVSLVGIFEADEQL